MQRHRVDMKNKITINTLVWGNLKQRKKQYAVMIIGIIAAMFFSTSVLLFMFSANETAQDNYNRNNGFQGAVFSVKGKDSDFYRQIKADGAIKDYGLAHIIGFAYADDKNHSAGSAVGWLDDNAEKISYQILDDGRYPENDGEIAAEKIALIKMGIEPEAGKSVTLKLKVQNGDGYAKTVEKTYTVVGVLRDKRSNILRTYADNYGTELIPAVFVAPDTLTEAGGKERLAAYAILNDNNVRQSGLGMLYDYINDADVMEVVYEINSNNFLINAFDGNNYYSIIIAAVLMITSCLIIVNSFNSNLKERRQQIGMLRAVGATKRQISAVFAREAFIISLICMPLSIVFSYGAVRLLLGVINDEVKMTGSLLFLPFAALLNTAVVMLAAAIPILSASRITPIQAIRNISVNRKVKTKKIKSARQFDTAKHIAKRNMSLYKGSSTAVSVILSVTILFSCLGFSLTNALSYDSYDYDYELWNGSANYGLINYRSREVGLSDSEFYDIKAMPYVSSAESSKTILCAIETDEINDYLKAVSYNQDAMYKNIYEYEADGININSIETFKEYLFKDYSDDYINFKNDFNVSGEFYPTMLSGLSRELFEKLDASKIDGKINYSKLMSGEEVVLLAPEKAELYMSAQFKNGEINGSSSSIVCDGQGHNDKDMFLVKSGNCPYKPGDKIKISVIYDDKEQDYTEAEGDYKAYSVQTAHKKDYEVTIGAIIRPSDFFEFTTDISGNNFSLLTTDSAMKIYSDSAKYGLVNIDADREITADVNKAITDSLQPYVDKYNCFLTSAFESAEQQRREIQTIYVTLLSIMIIMFAVCISIVNNALTSSIRENRKELGTLRAFGASQSELVMSYVYRLLSMFAWGMGAGFIGFNLFYAVAALLYKFYFKTPMSSTWSYNPWVTAVFCAVLFVICSFNLWAKIRKEMKNSIIENIREL